MPRRTGPDPVIQRYVDYLNGLFNSTISQSRLIFLELERGSEFRLIARYQNQQILPLDLSPRGYLHFRQLVKRIGNHVEVAEARYVFSESADPDDESGWVIRYEYDRHPRPPKPQAHLHVNAERRGESIRHIHFPTGRISIEQLIAHLILEYGVESAHPNTLQFLAASHRGFLQRRTDPKAEAFP